MRILEIIEKKKMGLALSSEEVNFAINGYVAGKIPDYQLSALLMAIFFKGMSNQETAILTKAYVDSGTTYDLSDVKGFKADKHSTGGVGDKTSLVFSPLVASYGIKVCKLSGRGLGQTGGTIDKLESFPGWRCELSNEEFKNVISKVGMSLIAQSNDVVPADKKIYALRDATATVDSMPLIAASIMSKKLVIDNDSLILDVKMGDGAFMKNLADAESLANIMIQIGKAYNRKIAILITDMNKPLGKTIGNALEVREAYLTLHGNGPSDLVELVSTAVAITLLQAKIFKSFEEAKKDVIKKMNSGEAAHFLKDFVIAQGGDFSVLEDYDKNFKTKTVVEIKAKKDGYVKYIKTAELGILSMKLGAGREKKEDSLDFSAGIYLNKVFGDPVKKDEVVMTLYSNKEKSNEWEMMANETFEIVAKQPKEEVIIKIISEDINK